MGCRLVTSAFRAPWPPGSHFPKKKMSSLTLAHGSGTAILTVPAGLLVDGFTLRVEDGESEGGARA